VAGPSAILAAALATRVAYVLLTPHYVPLHDDRAFDRLALGIARTGVYPKLGGFPTAYRPPGFSFNQIPPYAKATSALSRGPEPAFQSRLVRLAAGYVYHHPLYLATVAWYNTLRILDLTGSSPAHFMATVAGIRSPRVADATVYALWAVLALAVFGFAHRSVRRRIPAYIWVAAGLLFATVVLVNGKAPRLRIPIDPFILLLAGAGAPLSVDVIVRPVDARLRGRHTSFRGGGTPPDRVAG
jgi:hypothetical protein